MSEAGHDSGDETEPADGGYAFALNPQLRVSVGRVGPENEPVLIVEDLLREPQALVDYAAREVTFTPAWTEHGGYPGLRAPAPLNYVETLARTLAPAIVRAYGLHDVTLTHADCYLSLVTLPPDRLTPLQRIPHIDTVDPLRFALLHYLCPPGAGGTAFYRHRATGLQTVAAEQEGAYLLTRDRELQTLPPAPGYLLGDSAAYERTALVEDRFNRLVIYRSCHLHAGQIPAEFGRSADPRQGRLTANVFLTFQRAA
jgi:hypothetical protein